MTQEFGRWQTSFKIYLEKKSSFRKKVLHNYKCSYNIYKNKLLGIKTYFCLFFIAHGNKPEEDYMSKRTDIKKVMILDQTNYSGQACEFDYSGTQACKA